ncbi:MAG: NAD-dependent epimerase/dehydratase family protein [Bryobacteraceae bacterium]|nr:NAD-dependent epimerase/dehydratase family protein [Bryobacteraceae bacterium]
MRILVTGAAGFIGSNLVDRLLAAGHGVAGFDNLSTGFLEFLDSASMSSRFRLVRGDLLDPAAIAAALDDVELVFHLAANADVRFGVERPRIDLEQNTIATSNLLEAMRTRGVRRIGFASTGSIYGEAAVIPTPEDAPFPIQTSLYGASKLAAEGLIEAYCEAFGFQAHIFRFVSILGERYKHGHVLDFYRQLAEHPDRLRVLGNGRQRKSYLYVQDCVDAILLATEKASARVNIFNLGTDEYCAVDDSIGWICEELGVRPEISYSGGDRGWIGDNPFIYLDCARIRALGWRPRYSIREGIVRTVRFLAENREIARRFA